MAPSRRKGGRAAAAAAARQKWKVGDLVLAKMKGFPAWPAQVSEPEKWGYSSDRKKLLVYFYGTKQIAFCNNVDIEAFTEEKKKSLLVKRQGKGADFVRALEEIIDIYEKQKLTEVNLGDDGKKPEHFEGSKCKSSRKSPEISSDVNIKNQSEDIHASVENHVAMDPDVLPRSSVEGDPCNTCTLNNEAIEKVSILDQLRQTPLSGTTTTRRRQRDGSLQSSVIQRVPSLRRSRSSSGSGPYKLQKASMSGNNADQAGSNLVSNVLQEESAEKKLLGADVSHITLSTNGVLPVSCGLLSNNCSDDIVSDKTSTKSDPEVGSMLESCCLSEKSGNGYLDEDLALNGVEALNGKLDLPIKASILEKKQKQNRKRARNNIECATLDKEEDMQESFSESPNSRNEIAGNFNKANGDEHLPLVKRARVRMGKQSMEETQFVEFVKKREKLDRLASFDESDTCIKSSSPASSCPADRMSFGVLETARSSPVNDSAVTAGRDPIIWKVNKFQIKGITLDVEAALPPSKRLHRALEAMSANAAEATKDTSRGPCDMEIISDECVDSLKTNPLHPVDGITGSPMRSHCAGSSEGTAFNNNISGYPSSLASQNREVPMPTPSKRELDDTPAQSLRSSEKEGCKEILMGAKDCDTSLNREISDINIKVLQPCSYKLAEEQVYITQIEGVSELIVSPALGDANGNRKENETLQPSSKSSYPRVEVASEVTSVKPVVQKPDYVKEGGKARPANGTVVIFSAMNVASTESNASGSTRSPSSQSDESIQARDMFGISKEVKYKATPKEWGTSDLTPMKDLIAAAQKRLLSQSTSFPDHGVDGKVFGDSVASSSAIGRGDSFVRGSPQNSMVTHRPATDDRTHNLQNGSRSPFGVQQERGLNKLTSPVEAIVARRSFEALLCTLSRTKDSIGHATRLAVDCAKYGIAGEVIEILLQHLERESSMHKRVDLFFLVDSITRFSGNQKGGAGDVYLPLVQSVLPRLLSAAAPPGNAAWENRKQCLKVLRLWLERRTLPESIVRHHIRELESVNDTSLTSSYSRRPSRTERALNDPIREMEGMFVDEYGSNTSFQLQDFIHPCLLEDKEGSSDDEKSFEAVTPEHNAEIEDEKGTVQTPNEKQCHILEDVDGELEMEDVAPPCEVEASATNSCHASSVVAASDAHYQHEQHRSLPCAPPLPEDLPPSPPPLPSSPPPMPPPFSAKLSSTQQQFGGSHVNTAVNEFHLSSTHNNQNQLPESVNQQPNNFQGNYISSEPVPYYTHGYGGFSNHIPPPPSCPVGSSGPFSSHSTIHGGNNYQPNNSNPLPNKAYHLQPPLPTVSNQFSYIQAEPQHREQSWGNNSSFSDRLQYVRGPQEGTFYGDRNIRGPIQHENAERDIFSSAISTGSFRSDKRYDPYSDSSSNPSHGWSIPPRISNYSVSAPRSSVENPISRVNGASGYWRPR